ALFDTDAGPMAVILVGAMVVASIETVWAGLVTPPKRQLKVTDYSPRPQPITLERGAEMGRFKLGSTAIVLFGPDVVKWKDGLQEGSPTAMGEQIATLA
ncbi:MAG TPA: phosphatidylserine decarboxylase, partial [Candidatus Kapabacteria bacterium]|nr:phosphatidylserine decarboxylase [Candidatus Kapabacteria bacterium]